MSVLSLSKVRGGIILAAVLVGGPSFTVGMLATQAPAFAADAPAPPDEEDTDEAATPDLAIEIDDGQATVGEGDRLTYTVKIRNIGTVDAGDLLVTQTLPAGVRFESADGEGAISDGTVTWHTDLPAGRDTAFAVHAEVAKPPSGQLRLASVVCATINGDSRPIVCAADSDSLPTGVGTGSRDAAADSGTSGGVQGWLTALYVGVGVVGVALMLLAGLFARRRRPARPSVPRPRGSSDPVAPETDLEGDRDELQIPKVSPPHLPTRSSTTWK